MSRSSAARRFGDKMRNEVKAAKAKNDARQKRPTIDLALTVPTLNGRVTLHASVDAGEARRQKFVQLRKILSGWLEKCDEWQ